MQINVKNSEGWRDGLVVKSTRFFLAEPPSSDTSIYIKPLTTACNCSVRGSNLHSRYMHTRSYSHMWVHINKIIIYISLFKKTTSEWVSMKQSWDLFIYWVSDPRTSSSWMLGLQAYTTMLNLYWGIKPRASCLLGKCQLRYTGVYLKIVFHSVA